MEVIREAPRGQFNHLMERHSGVSVFTYCGMEIRPHDDKPGFVTVAKGQGAKFTCKGCGQKRRSFLKAAALWKRSAA